MAPGRARARIRGKAGPVGTQNTSQPSHHRQKTNAMSSGTSSANRKIDQPASFHSAWLRSTYTGKLNSSSTVKRSHSISGQPTTAPHTTSRVALSCTIRRTDAWWLVQLASADVSSCRAAPSGRSS